MPALPRKFLLVYPSVPPDTHWSFKYALRLIRRRSAMPPLGLVTVAAMLPQEADLRLVDLNIAALKDQDLAWADMVFVSAMRIQKAGVAEIIAACRRQAVPVVVGHHFHVITREMLKYEHTTSHLDRVYAQLKVMLQAFEHNPDLVAHGVEPVAAAWRWSAAALTEAQSRIEKIHVDFRADVIYHYETITTRIRGLFTPFASELNRHGIDLPSQAA